MYDDLRGRLKELAKIEPADDGMGIFRISAEGLEIIKGLATAAEAAIEDLSEQLSEQEVTPEAEHFIDKYADRIMGELQELKGSIKDKPRWIPVTERLPEKYTDVLIYYERNAWPDGADYPVRKREIGIGFCGGPDRWHVDHCSGVDGLAWMPLPEPPKEEA